MPRDERREAGAVPARAGIPRVKEDSMRSEKITIWREGEYHYPDAYGFVPFLTCYIHEDDKARPAILQMPGGAYRKVAPSEAQLPAEGFYRAGYNVFVLTYTINYLDEPLRLQPLRDAARAIRLIRARAEAYRVRPSEIAVCGFSAGGHLAASLCVHHGDIADADAAYAGISARPDGAVLCYPVITTGEYTHRDSVRALFGDAPTEEELKYMSLEHHLTEDTPPSFLWQTATDDAVPVENSYLYAMACRRYGVRFAHHVFSEGVHGMSCATQQWLDRDFGERYTTEQLCRLADAIAAGKTGYPQELLPQMVADCELDGKKKEKFLSEDKERIRDTLGEVGVWQSLACDWLQKVLRKG